MGRRGSLGYRDISDYYEHLIRSGKLVRQPCEVCGGPAAESHAHHPDYSRPDDIRWLCGTCHRALHSGKLQLPDQVQEAS